MEAGFVDAHVHIWTPDELHFPHDFGYAGPAMGTSSFTAKQLLAITQRHGVSRVVLVQMSFYGTDNSYVLSAMHSYPGIFSGIAVVDETAPDVASQLSELSSQGIRGLRITRGNHHGDWFRTAHMEALWQVAAECGIALCPLINPNDLPLLERMCQRFPDVSVVVDHMARIGMEGSILAKDIYALTTLARYPNTFVKASAFYALGAKQAPYTDLVPLVRSLYDTFGEKRLMWGSDSPFQVEPPHTYAASINFVKESLNFLSATDLDWILRRTAESIFF